MKAHTDCQSYQWERVIWSEGHFCSISWHILPKNSSSIKKKKKKESQMTNIILGITAMWRKYKRLPNTPLNDFLSERVRRKIIFILQHDRHLLPIARDSPGCLLSPTVLQDVKDSGRKVSKISLSDEMHTIYFDWVFIIQAKGNRETLSQSQQEFGTRIRSSISFSPSLSFFALTLSHTLSNSRFLFISNIMLTCWFPIWALDAMRIRTHSLCPYKTASWSGVYRNTDRQHITTSHLLSMRTH